MNILKQPPKLIRTWSASLPDHVISLAWSSDGRSIAAAAVSGPITVFDSDTGQIRHNLSGHGFGTTMIAWQPGTATLASSGQDGKVRLWDAASGRAIVAMTGGAAWVERLAWDSGGKYLASTAGKSLRLWQSDGSLVREYPAHTSTIADVTWRPGATDVTTACYGAITVWTPESDSAKRVLEYKGSLLAVQWSPDSQWIAAGCQDATVHIWRYKSGDDLEMAGYPVKVRELAWDPSSRFLATGGGPLVMVWDCGGKGPQGREPIALQAHADDKTVSVLAYQPGGPYLASGGNDGLLALWNPAKSRRPTSTAKLDSGVTQTAWSPTGMRIVAATELGTVTMYST